MTEYYITPDMQTRVKRLSGSKKLAYVVWDFRPWDVMTKVR